MTKKEKPEKWFIQEYFNRNIAYIVIKFERQSECSACLILLGNTVVLASIEEIQIANGFAITNFATK